MKRAIQTKISFDNFKRHREYQPAAQQLMLAIVHRYSYRRRPLCPPPTSERRLSVKEMLPLRPQPKMPVQLRMKTSTTTLIMTGQTCGLPNKNKILNARTPGWDPKTKKWELQSRSITLLRAEHLLKRSIRVIQSFKESPGQFLQSLVNNLEKRLSFEDETIKDLSILDQSKWPSKPSIRHGEEQIKRLCKRFNLCTDQALNGMRDLLEQPTSEPKDLKPLMNCMKTLVVQQSVRGTI
ncbi:unnamed protein product [Arctogadus glacialis]